MTKRNRRHVVFWIFYAAFVIMQSFSMKRQEEEPYLQQRRKYQ